MFCIGSEESTGLFAVALTEEIGFAYSGVGEFECRTRGTGEITRQRAEASRALVNGAKHFEPQMRRGVLGKSNQTLTPQKCEPSVQMGVVMPARMWQGGPMNFASCGWTSRSSCEFVHGGLVDLFLSVEAGAHGPFVEKVEERTGLDEANGFGVR